MSLLIDILLAGIVLGGMYALIAMGLTLQYGVARIMNLSHGEGMIAAAFGAHWAFTAMAMSPLLGLIVAMPLAFAANWFIYQVILMPLVRQNAILVAAPKSQMNLAPKSSMKGSSR